MNRLKTIPLVLLINAAITLVVALLIQSGESGSSRFALSLGLAALGIALINFFGGLLMLFAKDKRIAQGMLLSFGLLLLCSFTFCSTML